MAAWTAARDQKNPAGPARDMSAAAKAGPMLAPMPATRTSVPLAATIWSGCKWSFEWAMHSEYTGKERPPNRNTETSRIGVECSPASAPVRAARAASMVTAVMTTRRSKMSERWPTGHCRTTPPASAVAMNTDTSATLMPISRA